MGAKRKPNPKTGDRATRRRVGEPVVPAIHARDDMLVPAEPRILGGPRDRDEIMPAVCSRISRGMLVRDASNLEGVHEDTVRVWALDPKFAVLYQRSREMQAHAFAEQAMRIADGSDGLSIFYREAIERCEASSDESLRKLVNELRNQVVQRDRLRLDARKWFTSKIAPKLYGEKVELTVVDTRDIAQMTAEQLDEEARRLGLPPVQAPITPMTPPLSPPLPS